MCPTIPSLNSVCITIQQEETRKKVMNFEVVPQVSSALVADMKNKKNSRPSNHNKELVYERKGKGRKCDHCGDKGHKTIVGFYIHI